MELIFFNEQNNNKNNIQQNDNINIILDSLRIFVIINLFHILNI